MTPPNASVATRTDSVLDHLTPISLDELIAAAELMTRIDRKYVVDAALADSLVMQLAGAGRSTDAAARALAIDDRRRFEYASLYYDTPDLLSYYLSAHGRRRRFKVRRRLYCDSGLEFLEVKTRGGRGTTVKQRLERPGGGAFDRPLDGDERQFVAAALEEARVPSITNSPATGAALEPDDVLSGVARLRPTLATRYHRATLLLPADGTRVTVDTTLSWGFPRDVAVPLRTKAVVETKSGVSPSSADRVLWRHGARPVRFSKYGTGLAVLCPELAVSKWRSVHARHLADSLPSLFALGA